MGCNTYIQGVTKLHVPIKLHILLINDLDTPSHDYHVNKYPEIKKLCGFDIYM